MKTLFLKTITLFLLLVQQVVFANAHDKIIGGDRARPGQFPWVVYLSYQDRPHAAYCGGVLIAKNKVLTAGHCLKGKQSVIVAGRIKRSQNDVGQIIKIESITRHPNYGYGGRFDYDVATIILESDVVGIEPIKLYQHTNELREGTPLVTMGWGVTSPRKSSWPSQYIINRNNPHPSNVDDLLYVEVPFKEHNACRAGMFPYTVTERMLCAGPDHGGKDACQGDSGGPIVVKHNGEWQLVGLVSWGDGCARPGRYGIYANLSVTGYPYDDQ